MSKNSYRGVVIKRLRGNKFLVKCEKISWEITASVPNRFRNERGGRRAKIVQNSEVMVEINSSDPQKGEIISFAKRENSPNPF